MRQETILPKPKPQDSISNLCRHGIVQRMILTGQNEVSPAELGRRLIGGWLERQVAQHIPGALSVEQLRDVMGVEVISQKENKKHTVPDVFFYSPDGWNKTHTQFRFHTVGEIKGLNDHEALMLVDSLFNDLTTGRKRVEKALLDGGFPLHHVNKYNGHTTRIPLNFSPERAINWTKAFFSEFIDSTITLDNNPSYALLFPSDTFDTMMRRLRDYRFEGIDNLEQLFNLIGVDRVERLPWSRKEAEDFAESNLVRLRKTLQDKKRGVRVTGPKFQRTTERDANSGPILEATAELVEI